MQEGPRRHEYRELVWEDTAEETSENVYANGYILLASYDLGKIYGTLHLPVPEESLRAVLDELASRAKKDGNIYIFPAHDSRRRPVTKQEWQMTCYEDFQVVWGMPLSSGHLRKAYVAFLRDQGKLDTLLMRARTAKRLGTSLAELDLLKLPSSKSPHIPYTSRKRSRSCSTDSNRSRYQRSRTDMVTMDTTIDTSDPDMADDPPLPILPILEPGEISVE
jgi:hypothetical protein